LESQLESQPYVNGFTPSKADRELFERLANAGEPESPNLGRWFQHVASFSKGERAKWK